MTPDEAAESRELRRSFKTLLTIDDTVSDDRIGGPGRRRKRGTAGVDFAKFLEDWRNERARERGPETNIECDRGTSENSGAPT